jgi:hypothetical protein
MTHSNSHEIILKDPSEWNLADLVTDLWQCKPIVRVSDFFEAIFEHERLYGTSLGLDYSTLEDMMNQAEAQDLYDVEVNQSQLMSILQGFSDVFQKQDTQEPAQEFKLTTSASHFESKQGVEYKSSNPNSIHSSFHQLEAHPNPSPSLDRYLAEGEDLSGFGESSISIEAIEVPKVNSVAEKPFSDAQGNTDTPLTKLMRQLSSARREEDVPAPPTVEPSPSKRPTYRQSKQDNFQNVESTKKENHSVNNLQKASQNGRPNSISMKELSNDIYLEYEEKIESLTHIIDSLKDELKSTKQEVKDMRRHEVMILSEMEKVDHRAIHLAQSLSQYQIQHFELRSSLEEASRREEELMQRVLELEEAIDPSKDPARKINLQNPGLPLHQEIQDVGDAFTAPKPNGSETISNLGSNVPGALSESQLLFKDNQRIQQLELENKTLIERIHGLTHPTVSEIHNTNVDAMHNISIQADAVTYEMATQYDTHDWTAFELDTESSSLENTFEYMNARDIDVTSPCYGQNHKLYDEPPSDSILAVPASRPAAQFVPAKPPLPLPVTPLKRPAFVVPTYLQLQPIMQRIQKLPFKLDLMYFMVITSAVALGISGWIYAWQDQSIEASMHPYGIVSRRSYSFFGNREDESVRIPF